MRHIGQEFRFVAAGPFQVRGALAQLGLGFVERHVPGVEADGLLGQLLVGLLQFGLLIFQVALRLFQHARLFFQLFVGGAQFFLLDLQFLVQLLGFGQRFLQALAVFRRSHGRADAGADQFQVGQVALAGSVQEAHLDDAVDLAFVAKRGDHQLGRIGAAQARRHLDVIFRQLVQRQHAVFAHGLGRSRIRPAEIVDSVPPTLRRSHRWRPGA